MANQKKRSQVEFYSDFVNNHSNFFVVEYNKTPHQALESLRKDLKKANATMKVLKNTLFEKALRLSSMKKGELKSIADKSSSLKGPSAVIGLSQDWSEGLKAYFNYSKKDESLSFKFGFIDTNVYEANDLESIAKLPSKTELLAKVIGGMKSPLSKTVFALKFNMQKFVTILNEKAKQG